MSEGEISSRMKRPIFIEDRCKGDGDRKGVISRLSVTIAKVRCPKTRGTIPYVGKFPYP